MNAFKPFVALLAVAAVAACAETPTGAARVEGGARRLLSGSPPTANITLVGKRPFSGSPAFVRWDLDATGSQDPESDPISFVWTNDCGKPQGTGFSYTIDVPTFTTCHVDLIVSDGTGQGNDQVTLYNTTITY